MAIIGFPTGPVVPHPASVEADIFVPADPNQNQEIREAHSDVHNGIVRALQALRGQTPDFYDSTLSGVPLDGDVPLYLTSMLGNQYSSLNFRGYKALGDTDNVEITFRSTMPNHRASLISSADEVEIGRNKPFDVFLGNVPVSLGQVVCDDVCVVLDDIIPDLTRRFTALTDAPADKDFPLIVTAMASILQEKARNAKVLHGYANDHQGIYIYDAPSFGIGETSVQTLLLSQSHISFDQKTQRPKKTQVAHLEVNSPMETNDGIVTKSLSYAFAEKPAGKRGELFIPVAKIALSSTGHSTETLARYLGESLNDTDPRSIFLEALHRLVVEKLAA
jgi:hypothetical protein